MLRESFELAQRRDGHAGSILRFVKQTLDPAHELGDDSLCDLRTVVNEILLLSGLQLLDDGRLVARDPSRTADDARSRADALRTKLAARHVHPDVVRFCRAELVQRNYFHAVLEASESVSAKIRMMTGLKRFFSPEGRSSSSRSLRQIRACLGERVKARAPEPSNDPRNQSSS